MSGTISSMLTPLMPSSSVLNVTSSLRYGSPPPASVVRALATFDEITCMFFFCARRPEIAISMGPNVLLISIFSWTFLLCLSGFRH